MERRTFADKAEALAFVMNKLPWGVAAGVCKDGALARKYAQAGIKIIGYGSITAKPRSGNGGDNFYVDGDWNSINAWGIPNKGIEEHMADLPSTRAAVNKHGSELWVSVSAGDKFDSVEYYQMASMISAFEAADVVEGNMSCGNMMVAGQYKPIVCYDLSLFEEGVAALKTGAKGLKTSIKLTPTTERRFLIPNVEICLKHGIDYIVLANTIPNSYLEKPDGSPAITMVRGGLGGAGLRPVVTGMIQMVAPILKGTNTKLIAAGGVVSGSTAYHYLKHGAHGFVCSSLLWANNFSPEPMHRIIYEADGTPTPPSGLLDYLVEYGLPA